MPLPIDYHSHPQAHSVKPYTPELLQPWADSARQKGLKEVCFTDHDRYHQGVDFDQIARLNEANPDLLFLAGIDQANLKLVSSTRIDPIDRIPGSVEIFV